MVVLFTGNTLKLHLKPNVKVATCIKHVLGYWEKETGNKFDENTPHDAIVPPLEFFPNTHESAVNPVEITMKLFLPINVTPEQAAPRIKAALGYYKKFWGATHPINQLILSLQGVSFADGSEEESQISDKVVFDIWQYLVTAEPELVQNFGIAELSTERLQALLQSVDNFNSNLPQPSIDHINASDCCALPPKLIQMSKDRGIKLLAHHDPQDLLPKSEIKECLKMDGDWDWMVRLTYIVKNRQVLTGNEYWISIL